MAFERMDPRRSGYLRPLGPMSDTRFTIPLGDKELILVGTAHVSKDSIQEVRDLIHNEKPDLICVELDESRYTAMTEKDSWENLNMVKVFKEGKGFLLMANLVLTGFQRRMGAELGVEPGGEMKVALELAKELQIPYALCDREIQVTLRRAWARCSLWSKNKLLAALLTSAFSTEKLSPQEIEDLKRRNELEGMMNELASYLPEIKETLIDERDYFLAAKIWSALVNLPEKQEQEDRAPQKIIAVVGAGHMEGIKTRIHEFARSTPALPDLIPYNEIPRKKVFSRVLPFLFPLIILSLLSYGFFQHGPQMSYALLSRYILWNGSLAALGALLAMAHPIAVMVSFLGAPITTMSPFVGIGLFTGLTQVSLLKPRVADAQRIIEDVGSIKTFYRNRITRALLVFFLSSLGSTLGTFMSVPSMVAELIR